MIPHFETVALHKRARALSHPMPHAGGWALASLSMGVGVGTTSLALYAFNQKVDAAVATALWLGTAFLLLLALVAWRLGRKARSLYEDQIQDFCGEIKMLVKRYGGQTADSLIGELEACEVISKSESIWLRLHLKKARGAG